AGEGLLERVGFDPGHLEGAAHRLADEVGELAFAALELGHADTDDTHVAFAHGADPTRPTARSARPAARNPAPEAAGLSASRRPCYGARMAIRIETPAGNDDLTEFILFHDEVYGTRSARWPAHIPFQLPTLTGDGPYARERRLRPFVARDGGRIVARALAVVDGHYQRHWQERLGHLTMFEALPDTAEATRLLVDAACEWLQTEGAVDARAGFGLLDFPFVIDS